MSKFASFDADGLPVMFYDLEVHGDTIPADAVKITDPQWMAFLNNQGRRRWLDGKVVPYAPPEPEQAAPEVITLRQAKIQLSRAGSLSAVNDFIAGMEGQAGEEARIEWEYATELRRDHPLVAALGPQFNLSEEDIDGLFIEAAKIA